MLPSAAQPGGMGWSRREPGFRRPPGVGRAGPSLSHALLSGMGEASGSRTSEGPSRLPLPLSVWSPHRTPQPWSRPLLPLCMPPHPPRRHDPCRSPLKVAHPEAWPHVTHHCAWHLMWSLAPALLTWRAGVGGGSRSPHGRGLGRRASAAETARVTSHSSPLRGTPAPLTQSPAYLPRRGQSERGSCSERLQPGRQAAALHCPRFCRLQFPASFAGRGLYETSQRQQDCEVWAPWSAPQPQAVRKGTLPSADGEESGLHH